MGDVNPREARRAAAIARALEALAATHRRVRELEANYQQAQSHEDRLVDDALELGATLNEVGAVIHRTGPTALRRARRARRAQRGVA